ncbi:MAG: threonine/serine exporter family protein [Alphaproteobacteria bacterium]|nr:threonine/serine exporter family protein [Alphaproteobacteria bacterium]
MIIDTTRLLHQALFGGIAAAGFGVLFNFGHRALWWCAFCGAMALAVRTLCQDAGWSLEAASFTAAFITSCTVCMLRSTLGTAGNSMALAGCIPMVPGAFFAQAILGLFALTAPNPENAQITAIMAMEYMLRVIFTLCAIGAGIAIPTHIFKNRDFD